MGLTVNEKEHFRNRLRARVHKLGCTIEAANTTWDRDIWKEAYEFVVQKYGVAQLLAQLGQVCSEFQEAYANLIAKEREVAEAVTGEPAEITRAQPVVPTQQYPIEKYTNTDQITAFEAYPRGVRARVMDDYGLQRSIMRTAHPVGQQLDKLQKQLSQFEDELMVCGTHKQLEAAWTRICAELEIEEKTDRTPRKVNIGRKNPKKG